ncbi:hypothetical protein TNCV_1360701 [Trichonephila clavipes]|nr:hypothetical protein TNCV_1360701 [Trichonephila clavipes]
MGGILNSHREPQVLSCDWCKSKNRGLQRPPPSCSSTKSEFNRDNTYCHYSAHLKCGFSLAQSVNFSGGKETKSLVYADKPQTLDHLEDNIRRVIADIRAQMLEKVIEIWTSRLDYIQASRGSHMPEIIFKM